jgi:23S rRNA pseudouridine955/2504/2580 synthase
MDPRAAADMVDRVGYRDDHILALNKPPGLAVQGGTNTRVHVDGLLDALRFGKAERPRLVHRLDKDTSGVLVLGRTAASTRWLAAGFRERKVRKLYWALVAGVPQPKEGVIRAPLAKLPGRRGDKVSVSEQGKPAETVYRVLEHAGRTVASVAIEPLTGRTHQIRAHMALVLGTPVLGDGKYGAGKAFPDGVPVTGLQLHAAALELPMPSGSPLCIAAPIPISMRDLYGFLGFHPSEYPFAFFDK